MANGTYYVDGAAGNDGNAGTSAGAAKATISAGLGLFSGGGNTLYVKASATYTITSTLSASTSGDTTDGPNVVEGYTTTPGARDGRPTITSATNSVVLFTVPGTSYLTFRHLRLTHTAATRGDGFRNTTATSNGVRIEDCVVSGCAVGVGEAFSFGNLTVVGTEVANCTSDGISTNGSTVTIDGCHIHDNAGSGFLGAAFGSAARVLFSNFAGNSYGVRSSSNAGYASQLTIVNCNFRGQTNDGVNFAETSATFTLILQNNKFWGNGGYGANLAAAAAVANARTFVNRNNAYGSNTSGSRNHLSAGPGDASLTADPDTSSTNFALNNTAGGGAVCRAAGFPGAFPGGTTTGYLDIGAVQHADAGGIPLGKYLLALAGGRPA